MDVREIGIVRLLAAVALASALSGCASSGMSFMSSGNSVSPPQLLADQGNPTADKSKSAPVAAPSDAADVADASGDNPDPYEKMNRSMFKANERFNHSVLYPVAKAYEDNVPEGVRTGIENFTTNLGEPTVFANDLLQLRPGAAATTLGRFAFNSTIGVAGIFDPATKHDMPKQSGDFGQTLYVWGMRDSKYLVMPIIGPTNVRDMIGTTVDFAAAIPAGGWLQTALAARTTAQVATTASNISVAGSFASPVAKLDDVTQMQALEDSSLDFYTMLKSVAEQKREAELKEALETSGWVNGLGGTPTAPGVTVAGGLDPIPHPVPVGGDQELLANIPIAR